MVAFLVGKLAAGLGAAAPLLKGKRNAQIQYKQKFFAKQPLAGSQDRNSYFLSQQNQCPGPDSRRSPSENLLKYLKNNIIRAPWQPAN